MLAGLSSGVKCREAMGGRPFGFLDDILGPRSRRCTHVRPCAPRRAQHNGAAKRAMGAIASANYRTR